MKKVLFIDRDGTLIIEPPDEQIDRFDKLAFLPGMINNLAKISRELDYELVMVTNQDGLGTASFPEADFWPVHHFIIDTLEGEGICFSEIIIDKTLPHENSPTRKPGTALLSHYLNGQYDLPHSFVIGDRTSDVELAQNLSCKSILIALKNEANADFCTTNWAEIYTFLKSVPRKTKVKRETKETSIVIELNLDGSGQSNIQTGIGFFDHMLEQLSKHGGLDLSVQVKGDLHIDEHHSIEDIALTLGMAFHQALGAKKGIQRYGFLLPMDDCLSQVAVDFGGRPWLVWDVAFKREKIGDFPTEMFFHFFKSFSDTAKCNINIKSEGNNEHHKIESVFKAFAKAVKMAVKQSDDYTIPSTKGVL